MLKKKYVASVSFGKDSVAMLLMLIEKKWPLDEAVFYDTGMEFNAIYQVREQIRPVLQDHGIQYVELKPERPFLYDMLEKPVYSKQKGNHYGYGWCGGLCRWGTTNKLKALDAYAEQNGAVVYIGIAADETKRLARLKGYKRAPLAEWGLTEADALRYCRKHGIHWTENGIDLYDILDRVSCWCCWLPCCWEVACWSFACGCGEVSCWSRWRTARPCPVPCPRQRLRRRAIP